MQAATLPESIVLAQAANEPTGGPSAVPLQSAPAPAVDAPTVAASPVDTPAVDATSGMAAATPDQALAGVPHSHGILSGDLPTLDGLRDNVVNLFSLGGPVVAVLMVMSVVALALFFLKIGQFAILRVGNHRRADRALAAWRAGDHEVAITLADGCRNPLADTLAHAMRGLAEPGADEARVREDVERVALAHLARLSAYLRPLELISQIAPLIGLFGTVVGMIDAFHAMQGAGANVDPSVLAGGIWVALLTTAVGLAIAIPTSMALSWFDSRIENERGVLEGHLAGLFSRWATEPGSTRHAGATLIRLAGETRSEPEVPSGPRFTEESDAQRQR